MKVTGVFVRISQKMSEQFFQRTAYHKHLQNLCYKRQQGRRKTNSLPGFFVPLVLGLKFSDSCLERVKNPVIRLAERSKQVVPFVGITLTHHSNWEDFRFAAFALKETINFSKSFGKCFTRFHFFCAC